MRGNTRSRAERGFGLSGVQMFMVPQFVAKIARPSRPTSAFPAIAPKYQAQLGQCSAFDQATWPTLHR